MVCGRSSCFPILDHSALESQTLSKAATNPVIVKASNPPLCSARYAKLLGFAELLDFAEVLDSAKLLGFAAAGLVVKLEAVAASVETNEGIP